MDKDIVEAYKNSLSPLGSILTLVDFLEEKRNEEAIESVAKKMGVKPKKVNDILCQALAEAEKFVV